MTAEGNVAGWAEHEVRQAPTGSGTGTLPEFLEDRPRALRWIGDLSGFLHTPFVGTVALLVAGLWVADGALANYYGYFGDFVRLLAAPALFLGVVIAIGFIEWTRIRYRKVLWGWHSNFGEEYIDRLRAHWRNLCDDRRMLVTILPVEVVLLGYLVSIRLAIAPSLLPVTAVEFPFLDGPILLFGIVFLLLLVGAYWVGMAIYIIYELTNFTRTVSGLPLHQFQLLSGEADLSDLASLSVVISTMWFVGVALATVVFSQNFDLFSLGIYAVAVVIGTFLFVVPQWFLHQAIVRGKERIVRQLRSSLPGRWHEQAEVRHDERTMTLLTLIRQVDGVKDWPVDVKTTLSLVLGMIVPVAATFVVNVIVSGSSGAH